MTRPDPQSAVKTAVLTGLTLVAFAANSILCRAALASPQIEPQTFTALRLASGAVVLVLITGWQLKSLRALLAPKWRSALALLVYALAFSFAYVGLATGTGALLLFAAVQVTMIGVGYLKGTRLSAAEGLGAALAIGGLIYLLSPGLAAPSPFHALLMIFAGIGWGFYSLYGKEESDPVLANARSFLVAGLILIPVLLLPASYGHATPQGIMLAVASGALASGIGYAIWYAALRGLTGTEASVVQLAVPVVAALGGIVFLEEALTLRYTLASLIILGGILVTILAKRRTA